MKETFPVLNVLLLMNDLIVLSLYHKMEQSPSSRNLSKNFKDNVEDAVNSMLEIGISSLFKDKNMIN